MNLNPPSSVVHAQNIPYQIFGGYQLGFVDINSIIIEKRIRGKDFRQRKKWEQSYCSINNLLSRYTCIGRGDVRHFKYKYQS